MGVVVDKAEQRYQDLLKKIAEQRTTAEADNLVRYHSTGLMVSDFLANQETRLYGARSMDNLAEDLKARPEFADTLDVKRFLYWSLALSKEWPIVTDLEELALKGFTVSHAKALLALSDKIRPAVAEKMIADGRVVSSRKLTDVIREVCRERLTTEAEATTGAAAPPEAESSTSVAEAPAPAQTEVPRAPLDTPPVIPAPAPKAKGDKPAEKAPKGDKAPAEPGSPLKSMKSFDKLLTKMMAEVPEVFIAIREAGKRGFDSDKAQKNYEKLLVDVGSGVANLLEPLAELKKECDDQRGTGE